MPVGEASRTVTASSLAGLARLGASRATSGARGRAGASRRDSRRSPYPLMLGLLGALVVLGLGAVVFVLASQGKIPGFGAASSPTAIIAQQPIDVGEPTPPPASTTKPEAPTADPNATPVDLFGSASPGVNRGQLNLPRGIAQDSSGNFFVADTQNLRIQKFDSAGKFITMFGSKGTGDGQFSPINEEGIGTGPGGLAADKDGNVYVADTWNHRMQKFDKDGKFVAQWGGFLSLTDEAAAQDPAIDSKFWGPRGVAVGPDGNIYVTDTGNKRVLIFSPDGKFVRKIDSGMSTTKKGPSEGDPGYPFDKPGEFNEPIGIAVDGEGNVYVADTTNHRIQKFDKDGKPAAQWPVPEGVWAPGPYLEPFLALDSAGNIYATAPTGHIVLKFSPTGESLGQKDKEGETTLKTPTGITVGGDGTVYVVDTDANSVINLGKIP